MMSNIEEIIHRIGEIVMQQLMQATRQIGMKTASATGHLFNARNAIIHQPST